MTLGTNTRQEQLDRLRAAPTPTVLIIGAGINGAGVLRELALNGVDAVLIDRDDFCSGTSAASGRVIHGGIRYLENGEFRLVREALHERNRLLKNAPHYVTPLPATMPMYSWTRGILHATKQFFGLKSRPGDRGALIIKVGMMLYDLFSGKDGILPRHQVELRQQAHAKRPELNPNIVATGTYYDARLSYAERLCLEVILDAEACSSGALALNYISVQAAHGDQVTLRDELSGETFSLKPKIVINATGAWIDFTNRSLKRPTELIGGTKGSHLVVDHPQLHALCQGQMFHFVNTDGRLTIFYPIWDRVLIGTTDIRLDDPDAAVCDADETDYLLNSVRHVFPQVEVKRSDIVFTFSGVRPLPRADTLTTGQISRDHSYPLTPPNEAIHFPVYSLVGGKWTTFRAFSEQVADAVLSALGKQRYATSIDLAIGGGKNYPTTLEARANWLKRWQEKSGLSRERLEVLLERYGTRAEHFIIIRYMEGKSDQPLVYLPEYSTAEIKFLVLQERVVHLEDVILRRTMIGMLGKLTLPALRELAEIVGQVLRWDAARIQDEIERTRVLFKVKHGVIL